MKKQYDPIDEILKNQQRVGQKITLANLRNKRTKQPELDEQVFSRIQRLRRYTLNDNSILTEKLNSYYCSLCGQIAFVTNILLDLLPKRLTDNATSIELRSNFIKLNLDRDKVKYIKRQEGIEAQYRWKCDCGISIGYTAINYQQFQALRLDQKTKVSNRSYFYVYDGAVVQKMKQSKLLSEIITYKQTILLHLKRKTKK